MQDLLALEHAGWDSLCRSDGGTFYGRLMTVDGLMLLVNGTVLSRDDVVASLDGAPPWASYALTDERLLPLGDDVTALIYRARAERDGEPPFTAIMTSTYRLVDGEIRLALYQQTTATH